LRPTPGLDHLNLFQNVKEAVLTASGGAQQPWESNGLGRRVYLTGRPKRTSQVVTNTEVSGLAKRLQQTLKNYGCYRGDVDGVWSGSSEQALALFARENGEELEDLKPTLENIIKVEGGVSAGCPSLGPDGKNRQTEASGCAPKSGDVVILSEPDPAKPYPDAPGIGTSWSLVDVQVIANSKGRFLYGRLFSPRGGYQKWVYGRAEHWDCVWPTQGIRPTVPGSGRDFIVNIGDIVYFATEGVDLSSEAQQALVNQARWLQQYSNHKVVIEGHDDNRSSREKSIALGTQRAVAVRAFLIAHGVEASRIAVHSYGHDRPVATCENISCWTQNRRAQTVLQP
jgi:outer membrane protein OmpA-like peptidoglycan-associated protein